MMGDREDLKAKMSSVGDGFNGTRLGTEDENSQLNLPATDGNNTSTQSLEGWLLPEEQLDCDDRERVVHEHQKFQTDLSTNPKNVLPSSSIIDKTVKQPSAKQLVESARMNSVTTSSSGQDARPLPGNKDVKELAVPKLDNNSGRIVKVPRPQFPPPDGLSARSQLVAGLNNLNTNSYIDHITDHNVLMHPRHEDVNSRVLTVKGVFGTDIRDWNGAASQGCINPCYSSQQVRLHTVPDVGSLKHTIPEVSSSWKPVEINLGRCVTSMSRPWYSQADMCMLPQDLENNSMEPL